MVDVGEGVATCAAVVNGKQRKYINCDPSEATPTKLAQMVHTVVTETSVEDCAAEATLLQNVVLTGKMYFDTAHFGLKKLSMFVFSHPQEEDLLPSIFFKLTYWQLTGTTTYEKQVSSRL